MQFANLQFRFNITVIFMSLIVFSLELKAQVTLLKPLNILEGLDDRTIQVMVDPALSSGVIEDVFDGNLSTIASIQNHDTLMITLGFNDLIMLGKSKGYFLSSGQWSLESARTEDDLNNATGTYQLLVDQKQHFQFSWDSVSFPPVNAKFIRLTSQNPTGDKIYISEWGLEESIPITSLLILPHPPRLLPETSLQLSVNMLDGLNNVYPYDLNEVIIWSSNNPSVATFDSSGKLHGVSLGTAEITASTELGPLTGTATASVESDFQSPKTPPKTVKVSLVLQDQLTANGQRLHQRFGWNNPNVLVNNIKEDFQNISDDVVLFQIVETLDDPVIFTRMYGDFIALDSLVAYYSIPGWTPLVNALNQGQLQFDYHEMITYYDLCTKRDQGLIDEVWVYAHPYAAMYESRLAGQNAFWYNSPPLSGTGCVKLLSIMGLNYERGVAEALHSFGHRVESAMRKVYGRWDTNAPDPNNWEIFTRIGKDHPGEAHIGNVHFPPNGLSDYDYSNTTSVITYADNWNRYPYLLDQTRTVNCVEWNCGHLGYMRWWYNHLPRYEGVTAGVLNNWWHYMIDYEEAVNLANNTTPIVKIQDNISKQIPSGYFLDKNYPNPFNPTTTISFSLPRAGTVKLKVFNILGREVATLVDKWMMAGRHAVQFDANELSSGVYFYRLSTGNFQETKKMLLIK